MRNSETFRILTVCTGNICRSPVAERLLQKGLDDLHPGKFIVSSAGTSALVGQPMQPHSAEIVRARGGSADGFAARQLSAPMVREADLVLALTAGHRTQILQLAPVALRRTFTIREFARMLDHLAQTPNPEESMEDILAAWRSLPSAAGSVRHLTLASTPLDDDVVDPYRQDASVYEQMAHQLLPALNAVTHFPSRT
ncbi:low molecular weight phosphatase family protein [Pseudarthrobacter sp. J64]|uniref:arsenate reductase/protein-tyrosine-phosphatase family protein n=1 Tax=Pseudarthrobacter sp. J64 TaxID=3116485 RepID=UPI002E802079|nr:low molecular weight phosphatase family protein [Pseudarthrobacter sp. J64]MEE2567924.1 low molecular weight phosphatase family protein [Pseudarthrobacter sp. J64]